MCVRESGVCLFCLFAPQIYRSPHTAAGHNTKLKHVRAHIAEQYRAAVAPGNEDG